MNKKELEALPIDPVWKKILLVSVPKSDTHEWTLYPAFRVAQSFDLSSFSAKVARKVERYFLDSIKAQKVDIAFHKRWSPEVYHPNTYKSIELEEKGMRASLIKLSAELKKRAKK